MKFRFLRNEINLLNENIFNSFNYKVSKDAFAHTLKTI